jgi:quinol monooxygenase YgiN
MLIVAGTITFDPVHQQEMVDAAHVVAEETRKEAGCMSYEFFADLSTPGRFHLFEEWEDEAALLTHLETEHLATFYGVLQASGLASRDINRYYVSSYGPNRPGPGGAVQTS